MFSVQNKILVLSLAVLISATGCNKLGFNKDSREAENLARHIENLISAGRYSEAINMIDTLNLKYPKEIEWRRATLLLKAQAMEGVIRDSIPVADAAIVATRLEMDSLANFFVTVSEKGFSDYSVDKSLKNKSLLSGNSVQPRLGDATSPWVLVVSVSGNKDITGLMLSDSEGSVYTDAKNPENRRVKGSSNEMFSFTADEAEPLGEFLAAKGVITQPLKLTVLGSRGNTQISLSPETANAIARTYRLAQVKEEHRKALMHRELLERKLIVAQNQAANFRQDNQTN